MTEEQAFLAAIAEALEDDAPRLIYADWLEERGDSERAEFIRVQCELANRKIRTPCHLSNWTCLGPGMVLDSDCGPDAEYSDPHVRREHELYYAGYPQAAWRWAGEPLNQLNRVDYIFRRGFIDSITLPCADWLAHGPAILEAAPMLREVRLSDKEPRQGNGSYEWWLDREVANIHPASDIPSVLFNSLEMTVEGGRLWQVYPSVAIAKSALSQACLALARGKGPINLIAPGCKLS